MGHSFDVQRTDNRLTVRAVYFSPLPAIFGTLVLAVIVFVGVRRGDTNLDNPFELTIIGVLFAVCIFGTFHRTTVTVFDMTTRTVVQQRTLFAVWHWRKQSYAFAEIAGVGVDELEDGDGDPQFSVIMTLKDGRIVRLDQRVQNATTCAQAAESIRAATGLPRVDRSSRAQAEAA